MRITPRKAEVEHVVEAIDQDHDTVQAAAKAAIKAVAEAMDLRDFYTLVDPGEPTLLWGLFTSEIEAEKAASKLRGTGAYGRLIPWPVLGLARTMANIDGVPMDEDCECGHPQTLHKFEASSRGECGLSTCGCKKLKKAKHPIPSLPTCITCKQPIDRQEAA